ncbi:GNAT family N-acetyltransferase [Candidatus Shapirobacteria bacterium]|nr:GNAT family N-acetyltransferase [Candidatus Shapirobacteria bacterium]
MYATDYSWQVNWLAVHPECRRRGIGTGLINALFRQAKKIRLKRIFVETCSCEEERPARAFYEKNGFKQIALIPEFYGANHSKVIYQKELDQ